MKIAFLADMINGEPSDTVEIIVETKGLIIVGTQVKTIRHKRFVLSKGDPYTHEETCTEDVSLFFIREGANEYGSKTITREQWMDKMKDAACSQNGLCCNWLVVNGCYLIVNQKRVVI